MTSTAEEAIRISTGKIMAEIEDGRRAAHRKHGENSIEAVPADDIARWLPILGEEFGEVNECLTYDKDRGNLRKELIDTATVAVAWIAAIDRMESEVAAYGTIRAETEPSEAERKVMAREYARRMRSPLSSAD